MSIVDSCIKNFLPLANPHIFSLHILPRESYSSSSIPGSQSNSSNPYRASMHQTEATNKLSPPTSRPTTSGTRHFPDFSTHLDPDSTPKSMEAATQDVEAVEVLDNRGNEWSTLPRGLESTKPGGKGAVNVAGGCGGF